IDRGEVVTQGAIADIAAGQERLVIIGCDDMEKAQRLLAGHAGIASVASRDRELRVTLDGDGNAQATAAAMNRTLVEAGLAVHPVGPSHISVEEGFLEITARLGAEA